MKVKLFVLLMLMMFFQYAVWGSWFSIFSGTLNNRHVAGAEIGLVFAMFWLGNMLTPFLGGQLVDRIMPSQYFLAIAHLLSAGVAFQLSQQTTTSGLVGWMIVYSIVFTPTLAITNSLAFHHTDHMGQTEPERERNFSLVRTAGTVGWIVAGLCLPLFISFTHSDPNGVVGPITELRWCALIGIVMSVFSLFLPNTPPNKDKNSDPLAFRRAFALFKTVPGFSVFMLISFFAATEFQFFYGLSAQYLQSLSVPHALVPVYKNISQVAEVGALAVLLPLLLPKKGMKWCLLLGSFAWPLRYIIFALGNVWIVVPSLGLHGFGYAFVLVVQQLYVDRVAPRDIRGSAQSLLNLVTLGLGNVLGSYFCGWVQQYFTHNGVTNWVPVFILPTVTTLICAFAYMFTFKNPVGDHEVSAESA